MYERCGMWYWGSTFSVVSMRSDTLCIYEKASAFPQQSCLVGGGMCKMMVQNACAD
jgi:hypothetical protein